MTIDRGFTVKRPSVALHDFVKAREQLVDLVVIERRHNKFLSSKRGVYILVNCIVRYVNFVNDRI